MHCTGFSVLIVCVMRGKSRTKPLYKMFVNAIYSLETWVTCLQGKSSQYQDRFFFGGGGRRIDCTQCTVCKNVLFQRVTAL